MSDLGPYVVQYDPRGDEGADEARQAGRAADCRAIDGLGAQPRPPSARSLVGYPGLWRLRIGGYRVVYAIKDAELVMLALRVAHRRHVYRNL